MVIFYSVFQLYLMQQILSFLDLIIIFQFKLLILRLKYDFTQNLPPKALYLFPPLLPLFLQVALQTICHFLRNYPQHNVLYSHQYLKVLVTLHPFLLILLDRHLTPTPQGLI